MLKKLDWKTWTLIGLGSTTAVVTAALFIQWKHAAVGRQVSKNVVRFLTDYGSQVNNGVMSGGVLAQPMKVNTAVNAVIVQMLNKVADELNEHGFGDKKKGSSSRARTEDHGEDDSAPVYTRTPARRESRKKDEGAVPVVPKPSKKTKPRGHGKRDARAKDDKSPLEIGHPPDDGGYGNNPTQNGHEYNVDEFRSQATGGARPPQNAKLFSDDEAVGPVEDFE